MGDGFAGEHGLVEKDLSRGEAPICCNDPLFHGCLRRRSLSNCEFPLRHSATTALTTCTIPPPTAAG